MALFQGISAFPITPADEHGVVDNEGVARLVTHLADAQVDSIGLLGSTGTYAYLSRTERRRAIRAAVRAVAGRTPLMVGVGSLRTDDAQDLARDAEAEGADGLLMAPVSYTPLTQDEAFEHYVAVAATTRVPLCIYNNPSTTHFTFGAKLLDRLSQVPNVAAVKMPLPASGTIADDLAAMRERSIGAVAIGYSGDWGMAEALLAGADAFYSVLAGFLPTHAVALAKAATSLDERAVRRLDRLLDPIWQLFRELGSLRVAYAAAAELDLCEVKPPRPLLPVSQNDRSRIAKVILPRLSGHPC